VKFLAEEKLLHILKQQMPQTVLIKKSSLELLNKSAKYSSLTPFKDAYFQIRVFFAPL